MLGRWQPWHEGHQSLFEEIVKKKGQVNIQVRDVKGVGDNPFDFETVKNNIEQALIPYKNRIKITLVPNITNICYGRGVGYKIEEIVLPENIQKISATDIRKKIQFWSFPNILVIDLKRFNSRGQKNQILVTFPIAHLDLSSYVIGYKKNSYQYELYGVCNHSGGVLGGHYTSYVKNANTKWYHYNDTSVSEVGLTESIVSPKAYCLFYRKKQII
jgi:hypothetical protein